MDDIFESTLSTATIVILDTETTGLSPAMGHRVVEVAAVRLEAWREVKRFDALVNPGRSMDIAASRVNGIYDDDLVDAPPFSEIAAPLQAILQDAVIVAHNARFDAAFLGLEASLISTLNQQDSSSLVLKNPWLCTLQLARRFFHFRRNSLTQVALSLGIRTGHAHRALNDVYTTMGVLKRMLKHLEPMRFRTVGDLLHAQGGPIYVPQQEQPLVPARLAAPLAEALTRHCSLHICYQSPRGETDRVISPLYATQQDGAGYVVAYCHLRQAQRTFRLDRIVHARVID